MSRRTSFCRVAAVAASLLIPAGVLADSAATPERSVTELAPGIFMIRHADAPDGNPQGNTVVVIGEESALVVDSAYLPSSAREDIEQIRKWTGKSVRYLLNTHWHPDHQRGNATYVEAYPDVVIVAQQETPRLMTTYEPGNLERYPKRQAALRASLDTGRNAQGKRLSSAEKKEAAKTLAAQQRVLDELNGHHTRLPTLTFDRELDIDLGGQHVQIRHSGVGDTLGDAWAYVPKDKVLITGDVVTAPVPYFFAGYPAPLAKTLRHLTTLDVRVIAPGHGDPMRDWTYVHSVLELLDTVIAQVNAQIAVRGSLSARLEDVAAAIDVRPYRERFAGKDADSQLYFDESIEGLIKDAFYQAPK